jgi:Cu/Zn superoxide dismutase
MFTSICLVALLGACGDDSGAPADSGTSGRDSGTPRDAGPARDGGGGSDGGGGTDSGGTDAGEPLPMAVATIMEAEGDTGIMGTVTFIQRGTDVEVVYDITNCPDGAHPTHIHNGRGCGSRPEQENHWDGMRGELIPDLNCSGGTGTLTYTRDDRDPDIAWSIGGGGPTDILGHPVIIHGAGDTDPRIGCGIITLVTP